MKYKYIVLDAFYCPTELMAVNIANSYFDQNCFDQPIDQPIRIYPGINTDGVIPSENDIVNNKKTTYYIRPFHFVDGVVTEYKIAFIRFVVLEN